MTITNLAKLILRLEIEGSRSLCLELSNVGLLKYGIEKDGCLEGGGAQGVATIEIRAKSAEIVAPKFADCSQLPKVGGVV
jgi:hypothetical protein